MTSNLLFLMYPMNRYLWDEHFQADPFFRMLKEQVWTAGFFINAFYRFRYTPLSAIDGFISGFETIATA